MLWICYNYRVLIVKYSLRFLKGYFMLHFIFFVFILIPFKLQCFHFHNSPSLFPFTFII